MWNVKVFKGLKNQPNIPLCPLYPFYLFNRLLEGFRLDVSNSYDALLRVSYGVKIGFTVTT